MYDEMYECMVWSMVQGFSVFLVLMCSRFASFSLDRQVPLCVDVRAQRVLVPHWLQVHSFTSRW